MLLFISIDFRCGYLGILFFILSFDRICFVLFPDILGNLCILLHLCLHNLQHVYFIFRLCTLLLSGFHHIFGILLSFCSCCMCHQTFIDTDNIVGLVEFLGSILICVLSILGFDCV